MGGGSWPQTPTSTPNGVVNISPKVLDELVRKVTEFVLQKCIAPPPEPTRSDPGASPAPAKVQEKQSPNDILKNITPTGIKGAGLGVEESRRRASDDLPYLDQYKATFDRLGEKYGIPPALLAGIASRESRMGRALTDGKGDFRNGRWNGYGLMQVDYSYDANGVPQRIVRGGPTSEEHIEQAVQIFVQEKLEPSKRLNPNLNAEQQLQRAVALYNGAPGPYDGIDMDRGTTGGDYSNDVWARSQYFAEKW